MPDLQLAELFQSYFDIVPADEEKMLDKVYRIRHQVYCEELGFEPRRPDQLETDEFDHNAIHCLLRHKPSQSYVGCVRLVLADQNTPTQGFPFEQVCGQSLNWTFDSAAGTGRKCYGEISRLAVAGDFRRRRHGPCTVDDRRCTSNQNADDTRRLFPSIAVGLYLAITAMGLNKGLDGVFAMMEPRLARQLRRFGICFQQIGPTVEHRGTRAPYFISRSALLDNLKVDCRSLLSKIQSRMNLSPAQYA